MRGGSGARERDYLTARRRGEAAAGEEYAKTFVGVVWWRPWGGEVDREVTGRKRARRARMAA
jgi:hypothetical protein